jgi:protein-tyrosine phosphatase
MISRKQESHQNIPSGGAPSFGLPLAWYLDIRMADMTRTTSSQTLDSRFIPLAGAHNFRSVAHWRTPSAGRLKAGLLYRSSGLEDLTADDGAILAPLGIGRVVDLRSESECRAHPSRWHSQSPSVWTGARCAAAANLATLIQGPPLTIDELEAELIAVYRAFPLDLAGALQESIAALETGDQALLVHCAAGKDRTGFIIAMLLRALGIREEDVLADYLLTNACFEAACTRFQEREHIATLEARIPGAIHLLLGARDSLLQASDDVIQEGWGSFDAYLEDMAGLNHDRRAALVARMITW